MVSDKERKRVKWNARGRDIVEENGVENERRAG